MQRSEAERGESNLDILDTTIKGMVSRLEKVEKNYEVLENRTFQLEKNDMLQDKDIKNLTRSLSKIEENTTWLRRTITASIITLAGGGFITVVGGIIVWAITQN